MSGGVEPARESSDDRSEDAGRGFEETARSDTNSEITQPDTERADLAPAQEAVAAKFAKFLHALGGAPPDEGPEQDELASGTVLAHYRIVRKLGAGGQATVYLANDLDLPRQVALKVAGDRHSMTAARRSRLRREAEMLARLDDPCVCRVLDTGVDHGTWWIAMSYVQGITLDRVIRAHHERGAKSTVADEGADGASVTPSTLPSDPLATLRVLARVARAVQRAHAVGVIHRDIKPSNIMVRPDGEPVVLDFGLARPTDLAMTVTVKGQVCGTLPYLSPETIAGAEPTPAADVWAMGVTLYEAATGEWPFHGISRSGWEQAITKDEPVRPRRLNRRIPPDLETVILTSLCKVPSGRYSTMEFLADDLENALASRPIRARPTGLVVRFHRWMRREPRLATALVGTLASLVVALAAAVWALQSSNERVAAESERRRQTEIAEHEGRSRQADAHMAAARFASQRGEWTVALERLGHAEAAGYPDLPSVVIGRVEALEVLFRSEEAAAELQRLDTLPGATARKADRLLWEADLSIAGGDSTTAADALIRQALELKTLRPADEAYARALLSARIGDMRDGLESALKAEPFHHRANGFYGLVLAWMGDADGAMLQAQRMRSRFPNDWEPLVIEMFARHLLKDDQARGKDPARAELKSRISPQTFSWIRYATDCGTLVFDIGDTLASQVMVEDDADERTDRLQKGAIRLVLGAPNAPAGSIFIGRVTRILSTIVLPAVRDVPRLAFRSNGPAVDRKSAAELAALADRWPSATARLGVAATYLMQERWEDLVPIVDGLLQVPRSRLVTRASELFGAIAEYKLFEREARAAGSTTVKSDHLVRAEAHLRRAVAVGPISRRWLGVFSGWAGRTAGPLGEDLFASWRRWWPDDPAGWLESAHFEFRCGHYSTALQFVDRSADLNATPEAARLREAVVSNLHRVGPPGSEMSFEDYDAARQRRSETRRAATRAAESAPTTRPR